MVTLPPSILISAALCGVCIGLLLCIKFLRWIPRIGTGQRIRKILGEPVSSLSRQRSSENQQYSSFLEKIGLMVAPSPPREPDKIRQRLIVAGFRQKKHINNYYLMKYFGAGTAVVIGVSLWQLGITSVYFLTVLPILFWFLPDILLTMIIGKRLEKITMALPDFIDMCNIGMTAGLSWLSSVKKVIGELKEIHPEICQEFSYLFDQIQAGMDNIEAYNRLVARNPTREIQYLASVMIQNEKMGSSISKSLADLSKRIDFMRQQSMEEKAGKLPVKMTVITTVFFLLPCLLILVGEQVVKLARILNL